MVRVVTTASQPAPKQNVTSLDFPYTARTRRKKRNDLALPATIAMAFDTANTVSQLSDTARGYISRMSIREAIGKHSLGRPVRKIIVKIHRFSAPNLRRGQQHHIF